MAPVLSGCSEVGSVSAWDSASGWLSEEGRRGALVVIVVFVLIGAVVTTAVVLATGGNDAKVQTIGTASSDTLPASGSLPTLPSAATATTFVATAIASDSSSTTSSSVTTTTAGPTGVVVQPGGTVPQTTAPQQTTAPTTQPPFSYTNGKKTFDSQWQTGTACKKPVSAPPNGSYNFVTPTPGKLTVTGRSPISGNTIMLSGSVNPAGGFTVSSGNESMTGTTTQTGAQGTYHGVLPASNCAVTWPVTFG